MFRRGFLGCATLAAMTFGLAAAANAFEPGNVECIAPSGPGGGWDFTCRQVGKALYDQNLIPGPVQVTNMAGGVRRRRLCGGGVQAQRRQRPDRRRLDRDHDPPRPGRLRRHEHGHGPLARPRSAPTTA